MPNNGQGIIVVELQHAFGASRLWVSDIRLDMSPGLWRMENFLLDIKTISRAPCAIVVECLVAVGARMKWGALGVSIERPSPPAAGLEVLVASERPAPVTEYRSNVGADHGIVGLPREYVSAVFDGAGLALRDRRQRPDRTVEIVWAAHNVHSSWSFFQLLAYLATDLILDWPGDIDLRASLARSGAGTGRRGLPLRT